MVYLFGHDIGITKNRKCMRSSIDHMTLVHEARIARQKKNFDVDNSYVLCMRCGQAISLEIEKAFTA